MKDDNHRDRIMTDEDIESMLSPRCDFHTSAGFAGRVMQEAEAHGRRKPWRRILIPIAASVAAAAAIIIISVREDRIPAEPAQAIVASVVDKEAEPSLTPVTPVHTDLRAEVAPESRNEPATKKASRKKTVTEAEMPEVQVSEDNAPQSSPPLVPSSSIAEADHIPSPEEVPLRVVTEGPMVNVASLRSETSTGIALVSQEQEDYLRKLQISFITRTRKEIAATEDMLSRINMTDPI